MPSNFDIKGDIFSPGSIDTYVTALQAGLRSRGMLVYIESSPPTLQSIAQDNPGADAADVTEAFNEALATRHEQLRQVALHLPNLINYDALTQARKDEFQRHIDNHDGAALYRPSNPKFKHL